ncbi:MAG: TolB family protein [Bdellovibrio sp.]
MPKKFILRLIQLSVFLLHPLLSLAQLEVSPDIKWKTLATPHFEIIYNAKQQDLGFLYAEKLEKAYYSLQSYFHSFPEKTIVVINDKTDITNGYATRIPYPHIMAYPVLPGPEESLADTGDWAFELLSHEYTHVLNFEPAQGVMKPLRGIFGSIVAPNLLLPQWWKEGLAVEMETRLSNNGRLRSYYQDAVIRAMVEDETFYSYDIAQVNEQLPTWPRGMRPYLFGSLMWSHLQAQKGETLAGTLNERQSSRAPYFIETPAQEIIGTNYSSAYERMLNETNVLVQEQIKKLGEKPFTKVILPENNYTSVTGPAISPDGKHLALITEDDANSRSVKIVTKENDSQSFLQAKTADTVEKFNQNFVPALQKDAPPTGSIQRVSWFPDSERIVYDKIDQNNRYERFSDLYVYNLSTQKTSILSKGLRGREPSVAPDGKSIVFVKLEGGKTQLALLKLNPDVVDTKSPDYQTEILFSGNLQERISYPIFWDQNTVLFSIRKTDGSENLYRFSIATKTIETVFANFKNIRFAKKTTEGLLFTSGQNGVLNLYLADGDFKTARPVSHALTGFFTGDLDPLNKEIFATYMTSKGPRVAAILPEEWHKTPKDLPVVPRLLEDRYKKVSNEQAEKIASETKEALKQATEEDYSPYGYLWPRYWFPFVSGSTTQNGVTLMAQTSGFDPLKKHAYSLGGSWDTGINMGSIEGSYLNQVTSLPFGFSLYKRSSYLGTVQNVIQDTGASFAVLPNMFWVSKYASLQLGWEYNERSYFDIDRKRTGPFMMFSHANYFASGEQISPESGTGIYLGATNYIPKEGYLSHSKFLAGGEIYFSKFLPKHHAIMLRINGHYTPEVIPPLYGASTESVVYFPDSPLPQYILRGYKRGQILGRNLVTASAEYRMPFFRIYRGSGTDPLYFKRISGAIVTDAAAADGLFINDNGDPEYINMKRTFMSAGAEARLETTIGYVLPVNLVFGYYLGFNSSNGKAGVFATTLQISGF